MVRSFLLCILTIYAAEAFSQNWLPAGNGTNNGPNGGVTLRTFNGKLIAGGAFSQAGTVHASGVAMWDGTDWSIVDTSMNDFFAIRPLVIYNGYLYGFVDRSFGQSGFMIMLDSTFKWHVVPNSNYYNQNGYSGYVFSAAVYNDQLYVAGDFDSIGNTAANHIAKWNGVTWAPLGSGTDNGDVTCMIEYKNEFYVGGAIEQVDGMTVNHIAKWNGISWSNVGSGVTGNSYWEIRIMEVYNNELYIGGDFEYAGGQLMTHFAKWDGSNFSNVGLGLGTSGSPGALKVYGNRLFIGGYFSGGFFQNLAGTWDGNNFGPLGTGLNAGPTDFEVYNCQLYTGGRFDLNNGIKGVGVLDTFDCTTSTEELDWGNRQISIYPNPFTEHIKIIFDEWQTEVEIKLFDFTGHQVQSVKFSGESIEIGRDQLRSGIYFMQISQEKAKTIRRKIIVE
jgi:hypothetical protein